MILCTSSFEIREAIRKNGKRWQKERTMIHVLYVVGRLRSYDGQWVRFVPVADDPNQDHIVLAAEGKESIFRLSHISEFQEK